MKMRRELFIILMMFCLVNAYGQNPVIPVGRNKTTFIILYNTKPESANIGGAGGSILYEEQPTSRDTVKILKLQALRDNFATTNLLVVTTDTIFEFTLKYAADPEITQYPFRYYGYRSSSSKKEIHDTTIPTQEDSITQNGITVARSSLQRLQDAPPNLNRSIKEEGLLLYLENVGLDSGDRHHFFKLRFRNTSAVSYAIEYVKIIVESRKQFTIRNQAGGATQDEYPPYFSAPTNNSTIAGGQEQKLIYVVDKLPLGDGERLQITIKEQASNSRGRTITLKIPAEVVKSNNKTNKKKKVLRL